MKINNEKRILVTGFKPFGITGFLLNRNESEKIALKLNEKYGFETLILPVNNKCVPILNDKISEYKPHIIISFGQGPDFRIETLCKKDKSKVHSKLAMKLKNKFGFIKEEIGDWYCNDVYYQSLTKVPESVFIHVPVFLNFKKVDKIIDYIIQDGMSKM